MAFYDSTLKRIPAFLKTKWAIGIIVIVILLGAYWFFHSGKAAPQSIAVTRGSITEIVSVTGNSTPTESVSLAFGGSGVVSAVYASVGDHVGAGALLASLNTADLSAQLKEAQANADAASATLAGLQAGSRPEDIAAAQAAYDGAVQTLANMYSGVSDTASDAYAKANDAVRTQLSAFFSNAETQTPQLTFQTADSQAKITAQNGRASASGALNEWQPELASLPGASETVLDAAIQTEIARLAAIQSFLNSVSDALNTANSLDPTTLAAYKADLAAAISETNTAAKNLNTASQNISSQKIAVAQAKAELDLKEAGSTPEDIAAEQAQVESAQAAVASVQAKIANAEIVAPISGVVTQFDAKVGQVAGSEALISIISDGAFEVDADVPETDIGKLAVGNAVSMTFDAFPGETFSGKVFYIDPAETVLQGVVDYKVKVSFDTADPRMKSGLTANLDIATAHKDNVLILPEYAILENDQGSFVETDVKGKTVQTPVTLGLQDDKGNVEVVSGVTEGEQVLNIGLKQ